ncbi:hypothetical protein AUP68_06979 [Ilyonectria robusta]
MFVVSDAKDVLVVVRSHLPSLRQRAWVSLAYTAPVAFATQHILGRVSNSVGPGGLQWPLVYPFLLIHPPPNPTLCQSAMSRAASDGISGSIRNPWGRGAGRG